MAPDFRYGRIRYRKYALFLLRYVLNPRIGLNKKSRVDGGFFRVTIIIFRLRSSSISYNVSQCILVLVA
jgi:hypothetical protein